MVFVVMTEGGRCQAGCVFGGDDDENLPVRKEDGKSIWVWGKGRGRRRRGDSGDGNLSLWRDVFVGEIFVNSLIHISSGGGGGGGNGIGEGDGGRGCPCGGGGDWRLIKGAETRVRGIGDDGKGGHENDNVAAEVMVRKVSTEEDGENKVEKGGADFSGHDNSPLTPRKEQTAINTFIESINLLLFCLSSSCLLCLVVWK